MSLTYNGLIPGDPCLSTPLPTRHVREIHRIKYTPLHSPHPHTSPSTPTYPAATSFPVQPRERDDASDVGESSGLSDMLDRGCKGEFEGVEGCYTARGGSGSGGEYACFLLRRFGAEGMVARRVFCRKRRILSCRPRSGVMSFPR